MAHAQIEQAMMGLPQDIAAQAVVIGSNAVEMALLDSRASSDIDLAVPQDAFDYLSRQSEWESRTGWDNAPRLVKGDLDVGIGWGGTADYDGLKARSWRTARGLHVAGLADVYAFKQRRRSPADVADMNDIRRRLQDPEREPFEDRFIPHEIALARACLPEYLQEGAVAERAIRLAANGMFIVNTLYGHPQIGQANQITGELERSEYGVPATYHNGFWLERDARLLQAHLRAIGVSDSDQLLGLAIDPFTDAIYGGGRFKDNPAGHDELRSAELLRRHALAVGFSPGAAQRMHDITLDTTFDEATGTQRGTRAPDPLARGVVGVDLQTLALPTSVEATFHVAAEDGYSARFSPARILGRVMIEHDVQVFSTLDVLQALDELRHARPLGTPDDSPTAIQAFAARVYTNGSFGVDYAFPRDWTQDNLEMRRAHAQELHRLAAALLAGQSAVEAFLVDAKLHTAAMMTRFGE
ncbi:MAG TPA: hypothetical protein VLI54_05005 [Bacillota bacterium]|nr:hypothetical protein [Bacillota bacterium]